jgi:hypothetical protein
MRNDCHRAPGNVKSIFSLAHVSIPPESDISQYPIKPFHNIKR